ncbi:MAG: hypothetical protein ACRCUP_05575 [Mycoplasmatales bacterium]
MDRNLIGQMPPEKPQNKLYNPGATGVGGKGYNINIDDLREFNQQLYTLKQQILGVKRKEICVSKGVAASQANQSLSNLEKNKKEYAQQLQSYIDMIKKFISEVNSDVDVTSGSTLVTSTKIRDVINSLNSISNSRIRETKRITCRRAETILTEADIRFDFSSAISFGALQTEKEKAEIERAVYYYNNTFMTLSDKAATAEKILERISGRLHRIINQGRKHIDLLDINGKAIVKPTQIEDFLSNAATWCDVLAIATAPTVLGPVIFEIASIVLGAGSMVIKLSKGDFWGALEEFVFLIPFVGLAKVGKAVFKGGANLGMQAIDPLVAITKRYTPKVAGTLTGNGSKFLDKADDIASDLVDGVAANRILRDIADDAKRLVSENWKKFSRETRNRVKIIKKEIDDTKNNWLYLKIAEEYLSLIQGGQAVRLADAALDFAIGGVSGADIPNALTLIFDPQTASAVIKEILENPNKGIELGSEYLKESFEEFGKNVSEIFKALMKGA